MATVTPPRTSHHHVPMLYQVDPPAGVFETSFSAPDLDYKMKMMQLTMHFRAASTTVGTVLRRSPTRRHSIGTFLRTAVEPAPGTGHSPKILAVEPKFRPVNAVKPGCSNPSKVLVDVKSATLANVPEQTKVKRLVQLFEDGSGTTAKTRTTPRVEHVKQLQIKAPSVKVKPAIIQALVKPVQKVRPEEPLEPAIVIIKSPMVQKQTTITNLEAPEEPTKEDASPVDDQAIKDELRQRRKVKELCKFFEQQAKH